VLLEGHFSRSCPQGSSGVATASNNYATSKTDTWGDAPSLPGPSEYETVSEYPGIQASMWSSKLENAHTGPRSSSVAAASLAPKAQDDPWGAASEVVSRLSINSQQQVPALSGW
jgi:hypothetical protein